MASKMASLAVIGAGAYGASCAFNIAVTSKAAPQQNLRGNSAAPTNGLPSAGLGATGVLVAAGAVQASKRANKRGVQARAVAVQEEELLFQAGERVTITGPPAMAGK
eukprot:CAMPEP_0197620194 /NCGR_PEP_ID=MMETSP1338-20131121/1070_1 /TAXON_ID=43686 ORGANISM="Pelagodinium beii, Strain RCC1491" /NCGR_SAMPLE_ID=MMETSP1338 /ASSEMBLY_ACC=CAM_ASM_000754 /LENGTH=106 /DNA_ID=CAMNT_0043189307 /DNA_START=62 /DNA_END=379 /DNA_ORIENTATION=+